MNDRSFYLAEKARLIRDVYISPQYREGFHPTHLSNLDRGCLEGDGLNSCPLPNKGDENRDCQTFQDPIL
jgi:hypothetical protein